MNSIPAIKSALKASGRRITSKREVILDLLRKIPGHPDAETLFLEAKKSIPASVCPPFIEPWPY